MNAQFFYTQKSNNDSLTVLKKIDSLKNEIKNNFHNYQAIKEYSFYDDRTIPSPTYSGIPKFYDSLFTIIENDKKIQPEYYSLRAKFSCSRCEERNKIFKKGYLKFPSDYSINSELGNYYYSKFVESEDKKNKSLYADSTRIHLENFTLKNPLQSQKIKNAVELYQVYYFQNEKTKMDKLDKVIFSRPISGINLNTFLNKSALETDNQAEDKTLTFFYNIQILNEFKEKFGIKNKSDIYFNFILHRSFFKPILIYNEERKGKYFISYSISNKGGEIEKPFESKTREISNELFQNFLNILTNQNIEKSSVTMQPGYDGSSWFLESKLKDKHTLQEIWSPEIDCTSNSAECSTIKACLYLIKLSGLKTSSRKIENYDYQYNPEEPDGFMIW